MKLDPLSTRKQLEQGLETQAGGLMVLGISKANGGGGAWVVRGRTRTGSQAIGREGLNLHLPLIEHLFFSLLKYRISLYRGSSWSPFNLVLPHILPV